MLEVLERVRDEVLPALLEGSTPWNTLAVRYEPPFVNRCWLQWGEYRISLHKIYPCEEALFHPHPWPSAVEIFSGRYEMGIGSFPAAYGRLPAWFGWKPEIAATAMLESGTQYEMLNPRGWHYVKPLGVPSMSLMVTGQPWKTASSTPGKGIEHQTLPIESQAEILDFFRKRLSNAR